MGFRKAEDFYIALGGAKISPKVVVNKLLQRLREGEAAEETAVRRRGADDHTRQRSRTPTGSSSSYGIEVEGVDDVMLRLAKCCRPVPGDPIVGYISLGRGITIHRDDCPNVAALRKDPERFVARPLGRATTPRRSRSSCRSTRGTATACSRSSRRTFAEAGINIVEARCIVNSPMVSNRFVVEVGDTQALKATVGRLRNIDGVFDAYRVTPGG